MRGLRRHQRSHQPGLLCTGSPLDTMAEPVAITSEVHSNNYVQALELNPNNGKLYWNSFYYFDFYGFFQIIYAELYEIDPATGEVVTLKDFEHEITALCIPP